MTTPRPRPGILDIAPYVGGESKIAGINRIIKLSSNESAIGPSPKAKAAAKISPKTGRNACGEEIMALLCGRILNLQNWGHNRKPQFLMI